MLSHLSRLSFSSAGLRGRVPQASAKVARIRSSPPASSPFSRRLSTSPAPDHVRGARATASDTAPDTPKPYSAIPGRLRLPLVGSIWDLLLLPWNWGKSLHAMQLERRRKYGKIYRETLPGLGDAIMLHDANDVQTMCAAEGKYPARIPIPMWVQARSELQGLGEIGMFLSEGEHWYQQRASMSKFSMMPRKVAEFQEGFNAVSMDLVEKFRRSRDRDTLVFHDVLSQLYRFSFENLGLFVLGRRLGCLDEPVPADCQEWIDSVQNILSTTEKVMMAPPLYTIIPTKKYKEMKESWRQIYALATKTVKERLNEISEDQRRRLENSEREGDEEAPAQVDFLSYLMHSGKMSVGCVAANAIDMLTAGIDSTSLSMGWTLYFLAKNPEVQAKLRRQIQSVVGDDRVVTPAHISEMPYLRNCVKETLRKCPIINGSRILSVDQVFSGYRVPAGVAVVHSANVMATLPEVYTEPDSYRPERWDRDSADTPHPFASLPFGVGPRMCIGRRVAELELYIGLSHTVRSFQLSSEEDVRLTQRMLFVPDKPINIAFVDLHM